MARVALMSVGFGGHIGPAIRLAAVLARLGHDVTVWGPDRFQEPIQATGARFRSHEPFVKPPAGTVPAEAPSLDGRDELLWLTAWATKRSCESLISELFELEIELVVHDCHMPWARVAAEFLGLPRVVSNPLFPESGSNSLGPTGTSSQTPPGFDASLELHRETRSEVQQKWGVDLGDWRAVLVSPGDFTISYTTGEITGVTDPPPGWSYVGPLMSHPREPDTHHRQPLVYVAFGTTPVGVDPFTAAIDALGDEPVDVLVATGLAGFSPGSLGRIPANVEVCEYVDSREVLSRAAVHVTHGGCGSIHESLLAGVPMVCTPRRSDQFAWSRRVVDLGAGAMALSGSAAPDRDLIRAAVRTMLEYDRHAIRARALGAHLAAYDGEKRVGALIQRTLASA